MSKIGSCQTHKASFDFGILLDYKRNGKYYDFVLQSGVGDSKVLVYCHKIVLAAVSPFFRKELEKGSSSMCVDGIGQETLENLTDYIYGAEICLTKKNIFEIFPAAQHFMLEQLESACIEYVHTLITITDVISVFRFSLSQSLDTITKICLKFILENLQEVKEHGFLDLEPECVRLIAHHQVLLAAPPTENMLQAVIEWLRADEVERLRHAFYLIKDIPLNKVRLKILRKLLREDSFMQSIPAVYNLYVDAVEEISMRIEEATSDEINKAVLETINTEKDDDNDMNLQPEAQNSNPDGAAVVNSVDSVSNGLLAQPLVASVHDDNMSKHNNGSATEWNKSRRKRRKVTSDLREPEEEEGEIVEKPATRTSKRGRTSTSANLANNQPTLHSFRTSEHGAGILGPVLSTELNSTPLKEAIAYFVSREYAGGKYENSIVSFNLETKYLETLATHPNFDDSTSLIHHENKIYSLGGLAVRNSMRFNFVQVFDVTTKTWENIELNHRKIRKGFKPIVLGGYLYTVGGLAYASASCDVERLCLNKKSHRKWEDVPSMPFTRASFGVCVAENRIYVLGGSNWSKTSKWIAAVSDTLMCFCPVKHRWSVEKPMPVARRGHAVAALDQYIYVMGGIANDNQVATNKIECVNSVDVYDIKQDSWRPGVPMRKKRQLFSAIVHNRYIYAIGGDYLDSPTMERFVIAHEVWEDMGPLPMNGCYHTVELCTD